MSKLLRANFIRLFKSKFFWASAIIMFVQGPIGIGDAYNANVHDGYMWSLDDRFFAYIVLLFIITSILAPLFIGTDYACGTIRNKIAVGHGRISIYFSNLITLITANVILSVIYIVPSVILGISLLGNSMCGTINAVLLMLTALAVSIALTSLMTALAMIFQNRTYSSIICILLTFALLILGMIIDSALSEPEYYDDYAYLDTETDVIVNEEITPNPNYITGTKREVCEELMDITLGGQLLQITSMTAEDFDKLAIYDMVLLVLSTGVGITFFRRKDLK